MRFSELANKKLQEGAAEDHGMDTVNYTDPQGRFYVIRDGKGFIAFGTGEYETSIAPRPFKDIDAAIDDAEEQLDMMEEGIPGFGDPIGDVKNMLGRAGIPRQTKPTSVATIMKLALSKVGPEVLDDFDAAKEVVAAELEKRGMDPLILNTSDKVAQLATAIKRTKQENGYMNNESIDVMRKLAGLPVEENKLLNVSKLSSDEYQRAKKLKGFDKSNYTWNSSDQLYYKKDKNESVKEADVYDPDDDGLGREMNRDFDSYETSWITVSVRDAKRALEILNDQFRGEYEAETSDSYQFQDSETANDVAYTLVSQGIEINGASDDIEGDFVDGKLVMDGDGAPTWDQSSDEDDFDESAKGQKEWDSVMKAAKRAKETGAKTGVDTRTKDEIFGKFKKKKTDESLNEANARAVATVYKTNGKYWVFDLASKQSNNATDWGPSGDGYGSEEEAIAAAKSMAGTVVVKLAQLDGDLVAQDPISGELFSQSDLDSMTKKAMAKSEPMSYDDDEDLPEPATNMCPDCEGSGEVAGEECERCDGHGEVFESSDLSTVRKLAGLPEPTVNEVMATGPNGEVTIDDIKHGIRALRDTQRMGVNILPAVKELRAQAKAAGLDAEFMALWNGRAVGEERKYKAPSKAEIEADRKKDGKARKSADHKDISKKVYKNMMGGIKENFGYTAPQDSESVTYSSSKQSGDGSITISANAKSVDELNKLLQMAGLPGLSGDQAANVAPDEVTVDVTEPEVSDCGCGGDTEQDSAKAAIMDKLKAAMAAKFQ